MKIRIADGKFIDTCTESLKGVCLDKMYGHRAMLEGLDMRGASFRNADFSGTFAYQANLTHADFTASNLFAAEFTEAILYQATFSYANLTAAWFDKADLREANLEFAELKGAKFAGAFLQGANLRSQSIHDVKSFDGAFYDASTLWIEGFDPDAVGAIRL